MTALYKEGRNQETCKMIRDHKDHIPAAGQASRPRCGLSIAEGVFTVKAKVENREYLSLFVIGYSSDGFKFIFFYPID